MFSDAFTSPPSICDEITYGGTKSNKVFVKKIETVIEAQGSVIETVQTVMTVPVSAESTVVTPGVRGGWELKGVDQDEDQH